MIARRLAMSLFAAAVACASPGRAAGLVDPIDPTFGVAETWPAPADVLQIEIDASGRVLVLGAAPMPSQTSDCSTLFISAFGKDGTPDPAFGTNGIATSADWGLGCTDRQRTNFTVDAAQGIFVTTLLKPQPYRQVVLRLLPDGRLDTTFGTQGSTVLLGVDEVQFPSVLVQSDGAFIMTGSTIFHSPLSLRMTAFRLLPGGTPDPSFGASGSVFLSNPEDNVDNAFPGSLLALSPDGKLIAGLSMVVPQADGSKILQAVVRRLSPTGATDVQFGTGGSVSGLTLQSHSLDFLVLQGSRVLVAITLPTSLGSDIQLIALDGAGQVDTTFGVSGVATLPNDEKDYVTWPRIVVDRQERIVVLYTAQSSGTKLVRLLQNGALDPTFGADGVAILNLPSDFSGIGNLAQAPAGEIYAGYSTRYPSQIASVVRIDPDGGYVAGLHRGQLVPYYNDMLSHYFITADPEEQRLLDTGFFVGWQRIGVGWTVVQSGSGVAGLSPVCRFYGRPEAGLNTHFYSASPAECADVLQKFPSAWILESSDVFEVFLPDPITGVCPGRTRPMYRYYNQRPDVNHYFTLMPSGPPGWVVEGYGPLPDPVAMCAPIF